MQELTRLGARTGKISENPNGNAKVYSYHIYFWYISIFIAQHINFTSLEANQPFGVLTIQAGTWNALQWRAPIQKPNWEIKFWNSCCLLAIVELRTSPVGTVSLIQKTEQHIVTITPWFYFWLFMAQWDLKPHNEICYWYSFFCFNLQIGLPEIGAKFKTHWL